MDWVNGPPDDELRGVTFARQAYRTYSSSWGHDHCEVCGMGLSESHSGDQHVGFTTTGSYPQGSEYVWICEHCFATESEAMDWREVPPPHVPRPCGMKVEETGSKTPRLHDPG